VKRGREAIGSMGGVRYLAWTTEERRLFVESSSQLFGHVSQEFEREAA
jgi:hypothetical protein